MSRSRRTDPSTSRQGAEDVAPRAGSYSATEQPDYRNGTVMSADIAAISKWIDSSYPDGLDSEALIWRRVTKVCEESGEVIGALGGMLGENPRKGVTHTRDDLIGELLDVAVAALGAVEHLTDNSGESTLRLAEHAKRVHLRALECGPGRND